MDNQIKHRLTREIKTFRIISKNAYGDPTFDDGQVHKSYRHGKVEKVTSFTGEEVVSHKQFILDGLHEFSEGDVLQEGTAMLPIKATSVFDGLKAGTGTTVLYL